MTASTTEMTSTFGRVKWFNNKAGYGFITVNDCETNEERDIFVHHSEIQVAQSQYKYLVQGEYVDFTLAPIARENNSNDIHATGVRGRDGGKLMCETRNEVRAQRPTTTVQRTTPQAQQTRQPHQTHQDARPHQTQQDARPHSTRTQENRRPQLDKADQTEWMIVPRRRVETAPSASRPQKPRTEKPRQRQPEIEIASS
jgi:cold shock CspA family protein